MGCASNESADEGADKGEYQDDRAYVDVLTGGWQATQAQQHTLNG
jgi:hypothetical protein